MTGWENVTVLGKLHPLCQLQREITIQGPERKHHNQYRAWNNGRSFDNVRSESSIVRANPWMTGHVVRSFGLSKKIQFWDNHDGNLFNLIMFPKKILTRGTFVCEIDDISCCQSRPQIGYCCACCKVLKIARPAAPKITRIASGANKSEKKKDPEKQYNELGKGRRHDQRCWKIKKNKSVRHFRHTLACTRAWLLSFCCLQSELGTKALNRMNMSDFQCSNAILHT